MLIYLILFVKSFKKFTSENIKKNIRNDIDESISIIYMWELREARK